MRDCEYNWIELARDTPLLEAVYLLCREQARFIVIDSSHQPAPEGIGG